MVSPSINKRRDPYHCDKYNKIPDQAEYIEKSPANEAYKDTSFDEGFEGNIPDETYNDVVIHCQSIGELKCQDMPVRLYHC